MKTLKYLSVLLAVTVFFSCSSDDDTNPVSELDTLVKIQELENTTHIVELYSETGVLEQGYNAISLRIKDKTSGDFVTNATLNWNPVMHMMSMQHSCPKSAVVKTTGKQTLYNGYIVFQMASNDSEYWNLSIDYSVNGVTYTTDGIIQVAASNKQRVTSFMGLDDVRYILALVEPSTPTVALNDMAVGLFRMETMMNFPIVDDYAITIDPRMPSMGNHGSPNNVNLSQGSDDLYHGKLSLTMTGYWKINLQLLNQNGEVLKGESVTPENESSSLYLEIEF